MRWSRKQASELPQVVDNRPPLDHELIQELFHDPRWQHLSSFADFNDNEAERLSYDRAMTQQAAAAIYTTLSAEKQSRALTKATWVLAAATVGLVVATIVLVVVTLRVGG